MFKMILIWILSLSLYSAQMTLDDLISPVAQSISKDVSGNMSFALVGKRGRSLGIQEKHIANIQSKFKTTVAPILKFHLQKFVKIKKTIQSAKRATLFALVHLQKMLIKTALQEYHVLKSSLEKKDLYDSVLVIEKIILQIYKWKKDHPEAISELLTLEKSLYDYIKPGEDGTFESSALVLKLKELNHDGYSKYWLYPVVFGAGSISAVVIFGMFKWLVIQEVEQVLF
jgi:hypothetical protein